MNKGICKALVRSQHEVADIVRRYGEGYTRRHAISSHQRKVLHDISVCRTPYLGGHIISCDSCGHEDQSYNSCRNRHCPKCQGIAMRTWLKERMSELLPVPYFHVIFTVPHDFNVLVPYNERLMYDITFHSASETLAHFSKKHYGGQPGVIAVLHTWGQTLARHIHVHCIVTGGALSFAKDRWIPSRPDCLFDVQRLSAEYHKRFCAKLRAIHDRLIFKHKASYLQDKSEYHKLIEKEESRDWVVYIKKPFAGPRQVLEYLGRYTHRVAITNHRIKAITPAGKVVIDYKDYRTAQGDDPPVHRDLVLDAETFIHRFLQHVLPRGYTKIRFYGFLGGNQRKKNIARCKELLKENEEYSAEIIIEDEEYSGVRCPVCGQGTLTPVAEIPAQYSKRHRLRIRPCERSYAA